MEVGGIREGRIVPDPCDPLPVADVREREDRILLREDPAEVTRNVAWLHPCCANLQCDVPLINGHCERFIKRERAL